MAIVKARNVVDTEGRRDISSLCLNRNCPKDHNVIMIKLIIIQKKYSITFSSFEVDRVGHDIL